MPQFITAPLAVVMTFFSVDTLAEHPVESGVPLTEILIIVTNFLLFVATLLLVFTSVKETNKTLRTLAKVFVAPFIAKSDGKHKGV